MTRPDVVVVGGGLIGTAVAWRLARSGTGVTLVVGDRWRAASRVAAGMLVPVTETTFTDRALIALNQSSRARWPRFADEVEEDSGLPAGLLRRPTLSVAFGAEDAARLHAFATHLDRTGPAAERLSDRECRAEEPLLSATVRSGVLVPGDWSCDNRVLLDALATAALHRGVRLVDGFAQRVESRAGRVTGVTLTDGTMLASDRVVLANGAWAGEVEGTPEIPVRPVKGQVLRLDPGRLPSPALTLRAFHEGSEVYVVPREHGREVVVGATVEEAGFDDRVTAGGVFSLLRDARRTVPLSSEYAIAETNVGWRPGTPDDAPLLGGCELEGLTIATGHHRNGVLLTPVTAEVTAGHVTAGVLEDVAAPYTLARFDGAPPPPAGLRAVV